MVLRTFNVPHESRLGWSWWWRQRRPSVRRHYRCRPCTWRRRRVAQMYRLQQFRYLRLRRRHSIFAGAHRSFHLLGPGLRIDASFLLLPQQNQCSLPRCRIGSLALCYRGSISICFHPAASAATRPAPRTLREMSRPRYERHYRRLAKQSPEDLSQPSTRSNSAQNEKQVNPARKSAAFGAGAAQKARWGSLLVTPSTQ